MRLHGRTTNFAERLMAGVPFALFELTPRGECTSVSTRWCAQMGLDWQQARGFGWLSSLHPEDREPLLAGLARATSSGQETDVTFRVLRPDGAQRAMHTQLAATRDAHGHVTSLSGVVVDITDHVAAAERARLLFDHSAEAHLMLDESGLVLDCNQAALQLLDVARSELLIGQRVLTRAPEHQPDGRPSSAKEQAMYAQAMLRGAHQFEWVLRRGDHEEVPCEVALSCVSMSGRRALLATVRDRTQHKLAEQAIVRSRQRAIEASQSKSIFLANMSHEIRTPMNGVLGMLLLALGTELSPEQREYLTTAHLSAENLLHILNDILDLSKIEAGKLDLERTSTELEGVLKSCLQTAALRAHAKELELFVSLSPGVPSRVMADPLRLGQVLTNLLGNALKFTTEGHVKVALSVRPGVAGKMLWIEVEDTGIGISAPRQAEIFVAFQQAEASTSRRYGGTGLGLTICKGLIAMMGGELTVKSEPGFGSTFAFSLPLEEHTTEARAEPLLRDRCVLLVDDHEGARASTAAMLSRMGARVRAVGDFAAALEVAQVEPAIHAAFLDHSPRSQDALELPAQLRQLPSCRATRFVLLRSLERPGRAVLERARIAYALDKPVLPSDLERALSAPLSAANATNVHEALRVRALVRPALRALSVLVVEDHPVNAQFLTTLLRRQGHEVTHAANGVMALSAVAARDFDIVLMDVQMPEMDGLEATRRIRKAERGGARCVPIIALTANAMRGDDATCLDAGMDAYLAKPIDPEALEATLLRFTGGPARAQPPVTPSQATASAPPSAFSLEGLLERTSSDVDFAADLVRIFLASEQEMITDLRGAVAARSSERVHHAAHRIRSALELICAHRASQHALSLERAGRAKQQEPLHDAMAALDQEMVSLRRALVSFQRERSTRGDA
jgi:two-component system sensor histidine kinase/response regulator